MKLLVVEDEISLQRSIVTYLTEMDYLCEKASTFAEALMKSSVHHYDCILVDITLPGGSGLDLIRELKDQQKDTGLIIISAKNSLDDRLIGLDLGADDYLTKPFHLSELNARIKALLRRKFFNGMKEIEIAEISIDPAKSTVRVHAEEISLTKSEYRLLLYFVMNRERVLSKESIAEHIGGDQADMLDNLDFIYSHIKNLRKKIVEAGGQDYVKAVYGMGYKFTTI
ncbi:MAG: response regulator transcription factor [Saprospiraceae bacterium]|nr:response regulator transcription factor [Saprospiraceae bacterium]